MIAIGCKVLHFINDEDKETLGDKTLRRTNAVVSQKVYKFLVYVFVLDDF